MVIYMETNMINNLIGKICVVELDNGQIFCSKLAQIENNEVWFKTKNGKYIMDRRDKITRIYEYPGKADDVTEVVT